MSFDHSRAFKLSIIVGGFLVASIVCLVCSEQIMSGYDDCSMFHTVGATDGLNCATTQRMLGQRLFQYASLAFFLLGGFLPVFVEMRRQKIAAERVESIIE